MDCFQLIMHNFLFPNICAGISVYPRSEQTLSFKKVLHIAKYSNTNYMHPIPYTDTHIVFKYNVKSWLFSPLNGTTITISYNVEMPPPKMGLVGNKYPGASAKSSQIKRKSHLKCPMSLAHYSLRIDFGLWGQPALEQPLTSTWLMRRLQQEGRGSTSSTELPRSWWDERTLRVRQCNSFQSVYLRKQKQQQQQQLKEN